MQSGSSRDSTRSIAGGIIATVGLFTFSALMPILGFFMALLIPLPTLICRSKLGRYHGSIVPAVSALIICLIMGRLSPDLLFTGEFLLLGFMLGELFEEGVSIEKAVLYTWGAVMGSALLILVFYSSTQGLSLMDMTSDYVMQNLKLTLKAYESMNSSEINEGVQRLSESLDQVAYVLVRMLPSLAASSVLMIIWVVLLMSRSAFRVMRLPYPDFGPLNRWYPPEHLVWGVIGAGIAMMIPDRGLRIISLNLLVVLMTIYFFAGMAIVSFFFEKKQLSPVARTFLYTFIFLQQMAALFVIMLGFFDVWLDLRKIQNSKSEE